MKKTVLVASALLLALPATAQMQSFSGTEERVVTRVGYYTQTDAGFQMLGGLSIDFGQPKWQPAYDTDLDKYRGQRWRFGSGVWTTLDTNLPLTIGDTKIEPGAYYLVLEMTADDSRPLIRSLQ